jgi:hypothetical protein
MKIAFTICSNNYLAQAKTLADSFIRLNSDYKFYICLCDLRSSKIDYTFFSEYKFIYATELNIYKFDKMCDMYNVIELNTSIKPVVFDYLYRIHPQAELVIYFDPDIYIYSNIECIEQELDGNAAVLTPHILKPIEFDGLEPTENTFTQYGIFNLGFLATSRRKKTFFMLDWWKKRLEENCFDNPRRGIFVDQLPMNLSIIFFDKFKISKNYGLNMAPWNLHERCLSVRQGQYFVNDTYPLIFYHFSRFGKVDNICATDHYSRPHLGDKNAFLRMHQQYHTELLANNYSLLCTIPCMLGKAHTTNVKQKNIFFARFFSCAKRLMRKLKQYTKNMSVFHK